MALSIPQHLKGPIPSAAFGSTYVALCACSGIVIDGIYSQRDLGRTTVNRRKDGGSEGHPCLGAVGQGCCEMMGKNHTNTSLQETGHAGYAAIRNK
jgi:hypothetical protein